MERRRHLSPVCWWLPLAATLAWAAPPPSAAHAAMLDVPVRANVMGFATPQVIGEIVANDRFRGNGGANSAASGLTATFTFANQFRTLDDAYEFDWVQIVNREDGTRNFFPRPLPTIDPRPADNPDSFPFYYSRAEWNANTFAGQTIHRERMFSTFGDVPNQPAGTNFYFSTFLVIRDENRYSLTGRLQFCVLGGFDWMYAGAAGDFDHNRGTSTVEDGIVGPIAPRIIDRINAAIDSGAAAAGNATYRAWRGGAITGCTLTAAPEPASVTSMLSGLVLLLATYRRRKWWAALAALAGRKSGTP